MEELLIKETKQQRNYGIDLLRLISMFMVVGLHVLGQGGILNNTQPLSLKGEIFYFLEITCYCSVNVFAIISGFVGLKASHKYSNLINLCLQLIFYSVILTGIYLITSISSGVAISLKRLFVFSFPSVFSMSMWYFSAYFCLFFFMPILNLIIENAPRKVLKTSAVFIIIVFCCIGRLSTKVANLNGGYSVLWLAVLYLLGAYIKKYELLSKLSPLKCLIGFFSCVVLTSISRIVLFNISRIVFGEGGRGTNLLVAYTSPTILLSAIFLVCLFIKIKVGNKAKNIIAFLSPMAFGVYLIHCHPVIYLSFENAFSWVALEPIYFGLFIAIGIAFIIFVLCLFFDWVRLLLFKVCKVKKFSSWIENLFRKMFSKIIK